MDASVPGLSGITVNERLFTVGLINEWDSAIAAGDRLTAIDMLSRIELGDQADQIVSTVLADPGKYGISR